jgi:Ni/Co efflux regulator RcnB
MYMQRIRLLSLLLLVAHVGTKTACAQETAKQEAPKVSDAPSTTREVQTENTLREHHFRDKENAWLFAGVGAARALDYFSTLNMRRRGRQEIFLTNDVVDNHPAFAAVEVAATGTSIGASLLFHRYGHHKLERWTSFVHIGLATTGSVRNYCLKTAHPKTTP